MPQQNDYLPYPLCLSQISAPGVPYNVSVAAVNMAGEGEATVLIHFTRELGERLFSTLRN